LYYFFSIASFSWGKNRQPDGFFWDDSQPAKDFLLIVPEKPELAEEKRNDEDDDLVAEDQDRKPEGQLPGPKSGFIESHPRGGYPWNISSGGSRDGKSAKDQKELARWNVPLLLQFLKHPAKRRKKGIRCGFRILKYFNVSKAYFFVTIGGMAQIQPLETQDSTA